MRSIIIVVVALAFVSSAKADCDHFKWSLDRELGWIAAGPEALGADGEITIAPKAYSVALKPNAELSFPVTPERAPKSDSFGAVVTVKAIEAPGIYEISLSTPSWIDVVQNGARAKTPEFSGQKDCPAIHKSVKFELAAGAAAIQISNSEGSSVVMTIAPAR